jgi:hypothetical protein
MGGCCMGTDPIPTGGGFDKPLVDWNSGTCAMGFQSGMPSFQIRSEGDTSPPLAFPESSSVESGPNCIPFLE